MAADKPEPLDPGADAPPGVDPLVAAAIVDDVIRARRTSLLVDADAPLDDGTIDALVEAATWAPNHKRTWPWRFTVLEGEARAQLGEELARTAAALGVDEAKLTKLRRKYLRSPALLLVWCVDDPAASATQRREDRDATAAAVQNVLLAATARGVASFWATVPDDLAPAVRRVAGVDEHHALVALVYLGRPIGQVVAPERPAPQVDRLR